MKTLKEYEQDKHDAIVGIIAACQDIADMPSSTASKQFEEMIDTKLMENVSRFAEARLAIGILDRAWKRKEQRDRAKQTALKKGAQHHDSV